MGPVYSARRHAECVEELRLCTVNSLLACEKLALRSVAIPAISSGIFGFPKPLCAQIMLDVCTQFLRNAPATAVLRDIKLCNFDEETVAIFDAEAAKRHGSAAEVVVP